jgi:uncharacterized protein YdhG (YjbR/CyaY superfamily)
MEMEKTQIKTVSEYIAQFPKPVQEILQKIRKAIKESAPLAEEGISYQMPAFKQNGILVYFAAFKNHISFFPTSSGVFAFKKELTGYDTSKGTIRLTLDKPIPYNLIKKIVKFRVKEKLKKRLR